MGWVSMWTIYPPGSIADGAVPPGAGSYVALNHSPRGVTLSRLHSHADGTCAHTATSAIHSGLTFIACYCRQEKRPQVIYLVHQNVNLTFMGYSLLHFLFSRGGSPKGTKSSHPYLLKGSRSNHFPPQIPFPYRLVAGPSTHSLHAAWYTDLSFADVDLANRDHWFLHVDPTICLCSSF
ncbi:hypothetical protein R1flu_008422 [Riccia fluitans]|uniref:Uncharacterized protein n=1 Tax=Riccia fluitans TaxID=41844 RepID=A0ABD1YBQ2_9MARC